MSEDIKYIKGDATQSIGQGNKLIVHICNDVGGWGKGFVTAISKKWKQPEASYREWFKSKDNFVLGEVRFVQVEANIWVANMIAQHKINKDEHGNPPIRYNAVENALRKVAEFARDTNASVHMPRIGCGLAAGNWVEIESIVNATLIANKIDVTVYDF